MYLKNGFYNVAGIKDYSTSTSFLQESYIEQFTGQAAPWDLVSYTFTNPQMYNLKQLRDKYAVTRLVLIPNNDGQNIRIQLSNSNYKQTR